MKCYRRILEIGWSVIIRNKDIRKRITNTEKIIKRRKLRLLDHVCRMDYHELIKNTASAETECRSHIGNPCTE